MSNPETMSNESKRSENSPPNPPQNSGQITPFESLCRTNSAGDEFWIRMRFARVLGYVDYRHYLAIIEKGASPTFLGRLANNKETD